MHIAKFGLKNNFLKQNTSHFFLFAKDSHLNVDLVTFAIDFYFQVMPTLRPLMNVFEIRSLIRFGISIIQCFPRYIDLIRRFVIFAYWYKVWTAIPIEHNDLCNI